MQEDKFYENLVLAMLAVNNYSFDKVARLHDGLMQQGLFDPKTIVTWDHETACHKLRAAGYERGDFLVSLMAGRLQDLALFDRAQGLESVRSSLEKGKWADVERVLLRVPGIGPAVLRQFRSLAGG